LRETSNAAQASEQATMAASASGVIREAGSGSGVDGLARLS